MPTLSYALEWATVTTLLERASEFRVLCFLKSCVSHLPIVLLFLYRRNCGGNRGVYSGDNCEYLDLCAANPSSSDACNGNGQCLTLQEHALLTWNAEKDLAGVVYSTPWDKE